MYRHKKNIKEEKGQALVEFALLLPVLIILIFGMIEFGWLLNAKITLNSAAREGARVGAVIDTYEEDDNDNGVDDTTEAAILAAVEDAASASGLENFSVEVTETDDYIGEIHNIQVTVTADVDSIIGLFVSDKVTMTSVATMRRE